MSLTQEKNYAHGFGFDPQIVVSFFNELATEKRNYARGCFLIMDSKRITLWKYTMSRDKTWSWLPRDLH
jgi:hypothetical protein